MIHLPHADLSPRLAAIRAWLDETSHAPEQAPHPELAMLYAQVAYSEADATKRATQSVMPT
jgi:hypothetical protein